MEENPSWEADIHSGGQKITRGLWNTNTVFPKTTGFHSEPDEDIPHPDVISL
jgi:hypothetical protein